VSTSSKAVLRIIENLRTAGRDDRLPVLEAVRAVERYVFREGANRKLCRPYQGPEGPEPSPAELYDLIDELRSWSIRNSSPIDTGPIREFGAAERRRLAGDSPIIVSGFVPSRAAWEQAPGGADEVIRRAAEVLGDLRILLTAPEPVTPWDGPDFDELARVPRNLLIYMHERQQARIDDSMCRAVWGEAAEDVTASAIHGAINKANAFLAKRSHAGVLSKLRDRPLIGWA
jgi:hypothetical protein